MSAVTSINQFLNPSTFDFSTLFPAGHFYSHFAHPIVPIGSVVLYLLLSNVVFSTIRTVFNLQPKGPVIQTITALHSFALAAYSGWTFYNSAGLFYGFVQKDGLWVTLYDPEGAVWSSMGWWVVHFYISKYYEFIDTWIVLLKGRVPLFLQVYHHAGVVLIMWMFIVTKNTAAGVIILVLNSFIHTIMYTYYTLSTFGYQSPLKHYLTQAQLLQFFIGVSITIRLYWPMDGMFVNEAKIFSLACIHLYTIILIYLFGQFYIDSYSKKKSDKREKKK